MGTKISEPQKIPYSIVLGKSIHEYLLNYQKDISKNILKPGGYFQEKISDRKLSSESLSKLQWGEFLQLLLSTKKAVIFAETAISGSGSDWNQEELEILGGISVIMEVEIYDNGVWYPNDPNFKIHSPGPLPGYLAFTPGPLLKPHMPEYKFIKKTGHDPPELNQDKYNELIGSKLVPVFHYINEICLEKDKYALIVVPGIGCGAFSGRFRGTLGTKLEKAIREILSQWGQSFPKVKCVYFDPYSVSKASDEEINGILLRVRPKGAPQLSAIEKFQEDSDFSDSWDHCSLPGNDYFLQSRNTDDGVTGASTNSMTIVTGIKGTYHEGNYLPEKNFKNWLQVAEKSNCHLKILENVKIYPDQ